MADDRLAAFCLLASITAIRCDRISSRPARDLFQRIPEFILKADARCNDGLGRFHMRRICFFVVATAALILTAGIGGWTVMTTSDVRAGRERHK